MKAIVQLLNRRQFSCKDICQLSYDLYSVKITQPAIYQFFVKYFQLMGFTSQDLHKVGTNQSFRFLKAVTVSYGQLDNEYFLKEVKAFIKDNVNTFDSK
jgi:hypothetical protein